MTNKAEKGWVWPGFIHSRFSGTSGEPYMSLTFNVRSTTNQNTVYLVHPSSDWTIGNSIRTVPVVFNLIKVQWVSNEKLWEISPLEEQDKNLTTLHIYNFFPGHYGYLRTLLRRVYQQVPTKTKQYEQQQQKQLRTKINIISVQDTVIQPSRHWICRMLK